MFEVEAAGAAGRRGGGRRGAAGEALWRRGRTASVHEFHMQGRLSWALYSRPALRSSGTRRAVWTRRAVEGQRLRPGWAAEVARDAWAGSDGRSCPVLACHAPADYYGRCWRVMSHLATRSPSQIAGGRTIHARSRAVGTRPRQWFGHRVQGRLFRRATPWTSGQGPPGDAPPPGPPRGSVAPADLEAGKSPARQDERSDEHDPKHQGADRQVQGCPRQLGAKGGGDAQRGLADGQEPGPFQ